MSEEQVVSDEEVALTDRLFDSARSRMIEAMRDFYKDCRARGISDAAIRERMCVEAVAIGALMRPEHVDFAQIGAVAVDTVERRRNSEGAPRISGGDLVRKPKPN